MKHRNTETMDRIISFVNDFYRDNHRSPSLRQIAAETGFTSPKYFCRAYHAYFGHPPSKGYRKPS